MMFLVRFLVGALLLWCVAGLAPGCMTSRQEKAALQELEPDGAPAAVPRKLLVGRKELVTVLPQNMEYEARIDTGAAICSVCALNIERFERDGEKWVRFELPPPSAWEEENPEGRIKMELPRVRYIRIRQHGMETQKRPTVKLLVRLGSIEDYVEFSLVDRTGHDFPMLIGRNLLEGYAIVDVSKKYVASPR
ncbi:MAG: RimK/LysX family protein [Verrucomicrobiota bacterium]